MKVYRTKFCDYFKKIFMLSSLNAVQLKKSAYSSCVTISIGMSSKIIFRQQLLIITEKALYGFLARAFFVVETIMLWLIASFSTSPVLIFFNAFISMTNATPAAHLPFLLAKCSTKSNQTLIFGL